MILHAFLLQMASYWLGLSCPHLGTLKTESEESIASTARAEATQAVCTAVSSTFPMLGSTGNLARLWPKGLLKLPSASMAPSAISCSKALIGQSRKLSFASSCLSSEASLVREARWAHDM